MSRVSRAGAASLAGLLVLAGTGCASLGLFRGASDFERHWDAGRYEAAVEAFEADSTLRTRAEPLYRTGLLYADPGEPFHDPGRARELLGRLLELHPETSHAREARGVLALLERLEATDARAAKLEAQLERLKRLHLGQPPDTTDASRRRR